jgi:FkbM family methyltransferase
MGRRLAPRVASGTARVGVVAAGLLFGTKRWHRPITLRLDGPRGPVRFQVPDHAAFKVLHEMFVLGEYDLPMEPTPKRILDLGANIGASVLFFQRRWPDARVVAVEASPHLAALLTRNVAGLNVEVRHAAVAAQAGTVRFAASDESWAGSVGGDGGVVVPAVTLDELLEIPADLVKVDVEGAEFEVLAAATRLDRVRAIVGEAHALPDAPETRALLDGLEGFEVAAVPAKGVFTLFTAVRPSVRVT